MKVGLFTLLIVALALTVCLSPSMALTKFGELSEYHKDYADVAVGATISSPSKIHSAEGGLQSIITPKYDGGMLFADGVEQREEFTIDLGQERKLGMFIFEMTGSTVYGGELKRMPNSLTVEISTVGPDGPWTQVYKQDPADVIMSFALENVPARWVHFDLGLNNDGLGSRVRKAKIYPRYQLNPGPELMKEFHTQFRRDVEGLADFWKAVDAGKWEEACDEIIAYYAKWPPEPRGEASPRVAGWMKNEVEEQGCIYKFDGSDWDWFRMKPECPHPSLGGLPGASSILQVLSSSYAATQDEKYGRQLAALLKDWLQDLPCPGVHRGQDGVIVSGWAGIVASQRTWSFGTIVHKIFPNDTYFDRDLKINVLYSLWEHINFMLQVMPELGGNWRTNANSCVFEGAVHYPEFVQYKDWLENSKSFFEEGIVRDFFPSGKPGEDSTMYVPIAANQVTGQYEAMKKAGITVASDAQQRMEGLWDCFALVHYPDLSHPAIGDAHRESPLMKNGHAAPQSYLDMFDRPDLVYINTQGKKGKAPEQMSRAFSDCGWYIMRSAWETTPYTDARQMFFKASKGQGHGHPDQLSFTMYAYGRELLTDPGNTNYGIPIEARVRPTAMHSTICVDEKDQSNSAGIEHAWIATKGVDFVDAECSPYEGLTHRRQILFLKSDKGAPDYWVIRDTVRGEGEHKYDLNFHFAEYANPKIVDGSAITAYSEGGNAIVRGIDQSARPEIVEGSIAQSRELIPSKICRFRKEQAAPAKFDTLVLPFKGSNAPAIKTEYLLPDSDGVDATCARVSTEYGYDLILISGTPGTSLSFDNGRLVTDAAVVVVRTDKSGRVIYSYASEGTTTYRGKPLS